MAAGVEFVILLDLHRVRRVTVVVLVPATILPR